MTWRHLAIGAALITVLTTPVLTQNAAADLQRAKQREAATGDCKSVLAEYKRIGEQGEKTDRATAAEALLREGMCHERLADGLDQRLFERVAAEFRDFAGISAEARRRLKKPASVSPAPQAPSRHLAWTPARSVYVYGRVSHDGRYLPFSTSSQGADQLFIRDLTTGQDRQITSTPTGQQGAFPWDGAAAISPDGRLVAFSWDLDGNRGSYRQEIRIVDLQSSGEPLYRTIFSAEPRAMVYPHDWTPDQTAISMEILRADSLEVGMLSVKDGVFRVLRTLPPNSRPGNGASTFVSPDGKHVAYDFLTAGKPGRDVVILEIGTGKDVATIEHAADDALVGWTPDGRSVLFASDRLGGWALFSAGFSGATRLGEPRVIARDISAIDIALGVTSGGEMWSLNKGRGTSEVRMATADLSTGQVLGPPTDVAAEYLGTNGNAAWSPDGTAVAYVSVRGTLYVPRVVVVIRSLATKVVKEVRPELTSVSSSNPQSPMLWTHDGRRIILAGVGKQGSGFYSVDANTGDASLIVAGRLIAGGAERVSLPFGHKSISADGSRFYYRRGVLPGGAIMERELASGAERAICRDAEADLSPDGTFVYCMRTPYGADQQIVVETNLRNGDTREIVVPTTARRLRVSPDGQTMLAEGQNDAYVVRIKASGPVIQLAKPVGRFLTWAPDSKAVVGANAGEMWWLPANGQPGRKLEGIDPGAGLHLHPDGRRFVQTHSISRSLDEVWVVRGVLPLR